MVQGKLLSKVGYAVRTEVEAENLMGDRIKVRDAFPFNPASKTSPQTARAWADEGPWNPKTRSYSAPGSGEVVEVDNEPFHVTIVDLAFRGHGGRAYKVIDDDHRRFDLREDQLMEVFRRCGISAGGRVPGKFVWGMLSSQMHLVLVGGDLHDKLTEETRKREEIDVFHGSGTAPNKSNLQVGHVYRKRDGSQHLFIGKVRAPGAKQLQYAFVKMPEPPHTYYETVEDVLAARAADSNQEIRYAKNHYREMEAAVRTRQDWPTMTWAQRCDWEWYVSRSFTYDTYSDQVPAGYYDSPEPIVLMTDPKFDADTGDVAEDLARSLRVNAKDKHLYHNGHSDDLSEKMYVSEHGPRKELYESYFKSYFKHMYLSVEEQNARKAARDDEVLAARKEFKSRLTWVNVG